MRRSNSKIKAFRTIRQKSFNFMCCYGERASTMEEYESKSEKLHSNSKAFVQVNQNNKQINKSKNPFLNEKKQNITLGEVCSSHNSGQSEQNVEDTYTTMSPRHLDNLDFADTKSQKLEKKQRQNSGTELQPQQILNISSITGETPFQTQANRNMQSSRNRSRNGSFSLKQLGDDIHVSPKKQSFQNRDDDLNNSGSKELERDITLDQKFIQKDLARGTQYTGKGQSSEKMKDTELYQQLKVKHMGLFKKDVENHSQEFERNQSRSTELSMVQGFAPKGDACFRPTSRQRNEQSQQQPFNKLQLTSIEFPKLHEGERSPQQPKFSDVSPHLNLWISNHVQADDDLANKALQESMEKVKQQAQMKYQEKEQQQDYDSKSQLSARRSPFQCQSANSFTHSVTGYSDVDSASVSTFNQHSRKKQIQYGKVKSKPRINNSVQVEVDSNEPVSQVSHQSSFQNSYSQQYSRQSDVSVTSATARARSQSTKYNNISRRRRVRRLISDLEFEPTIKTEQSAQVSQNGKQVKNGKIFNSDQSPLGYHKRQQQSIDSDYTQTNGYVGKVQKGNNLIDSISFDSQQLNSMCTPIQETHQLVQPSPRATSPGIDFTHQRNFQVDTAA